MERLIYEEDVLRLINAMPSEEGASKTLLIHGLKSLSSVQTEVITCDKCIHWNRLLPKCNRTGKYGYGMNDFCSKAEQME